ncbi:MAG: hypothetical protein CVV55_00625 [Synergistetes bacterium HGW-Synergistetes-2]|nr:MAG: hypothetical protein CVV55_00625 [Synergistetes bacterium HGW-Synergistetes-2]
MAHSIELKRSARKALEALEREEHVRVLRAIVTLADNPGPAGCKKLHGEDLWRFRTGAFRIVYEIHDNRLLVYVVRIGHRSEVYKKM